MSPPRLPSTARTRLRSLPAPCVWLLAALWAVPASAQDPDVIDWAYGSLLGTGWYELDGDRQVFNLRLPPAWTYREADPGASGAGRIGIEFQFPVNLGLYQLDEPGDLLDVGNVGTFSLTPGVEAEIPVTPAWYLRAYGHLGWGTEFGGGASAWIYDAGVRSRYRMGGARLRVDLVNELFVAGYSRSEGESDLMSGLMVAFEFAYPVALRSGRGEPLEFKWDFGYRHFASDLVFTTLERERLLVESEWEVGFAFAPRSGPFRLGWLEVEHVGLGYRFSSRGDFEAVTLNLTSRFTR